MRPLARLAPKPFSTTFSGHATLSVPSLTATPVIPAHQPSRRHVSNQGKGGNRKPVPPPRGTLKQPLPIIEPAEKVLNSAFVPAVSFFAGQLPLYGSPDLTPVQCHEACTLYCDGSPTRDLHWAKRLVGSHPTVITPYALHYIGLILVNNTPTQDLGLSMLATAHELDYTPSTLQLVLLQEARYPGTPSHKLAAPFRSAVSKHAVLVRAGRDPSALALHAHFLSNRGDHRGAADYFSRAYRAGMALSPVPTPPHSSLSSQSGNAVVTPSAPRRQRWLLEGTTLLVHGQRLLKEGRRAEAEAAVRTAAVELDQAQAYAALAKIVEDRGERDEFTLKAAMAGVRSACEGMARAEGERAIEVGLPEEERRMRALMAKEWAALGRE